ncbi:TraM recognition domain-containing protein [Flavivirga eckloniae]|nr:type IV secretory system conjugative DNA transfer family protein [Flavivirga eckloniae]
MDSNKILLINVNKGELGSEVSHMISSLLLTSIMNAGFSRSTIPESQRTIFHIYLDEFQNYTNKSIINLLSEIRKYAITVTMATQYITALDSDIRNAVLGNVGNIIVFRVSHSCAKYFEKEMYPIFKADDFVSLANHDIYLRMVIDNKVCKPFSATTIKYFDYF